MNRVPFRARQLGQALGLLAVFCTTTTPGLSQSAANRLAYLDGEDPFYVGLNFPKLTTPQWVGEEGVQAVVTLGIDDMREHGVTRATAARYSNASKKSTAAHRLVFFATRSPLPSHTCNNG